MNVAVLGAAGFIGSHLGQRLRTGGHRVFAIDRNPLPEWADAGLSADLASLEALMTLVEGHFDAVFFMAGTPSVGASLRDPMTDLSENAGKLLSVLEALRGAHDTVLVYPSSAAVYGEATDLPISESAPTVPRSPYGVSKLAAESYLRLYRQTHGVATVVARIFSAYGPGARKQVLWDSLEQLRQDRELVLSGTGQETRDLVYVADICEALLILALKGQPGEHYNVCSGTETSIEELAGLVTRAAGQPAARFTGETRAGDPTRLCGNPDNMMELGWSPQVSLHEGVAETVRWHRAEHSW